MKRLVLLLGFAFVVGVASADARAQDCAGFTDVSSASSFCPNVEWLKNRAITLGCTSATLYCPGDPVSRLSMAAFLNRLGKALTPLVTFVNQSPGALDLDAEPIVCQTGDLAITGYPRQAYGHFSMTIHTTGAVAWNAALWHSFNGGMTWSFAVQFIHRNETTGAHWSHVTAHAFENLSVGQTVRYGVIVRRDSANAVDADDSRCHLTMTLDNRNGASSPYDAGGAANVRED